MYSRSNEIHEILQNPSGETSEMSPEFHRFKHLPVASHRGGPRAEELVSQSLEDLERLLKILGPLEAV